MSFYPNLRAKGKRLLSVYPWRARFLLGALFTIKLVVTFFNAVAYNAERQYDPGSHFPAISTCGFYTSVRSYNPPLYHWLSCPVVVATHIAWLPGRMAEFRTTPAARSDLLAAAKAKAFAKFEAETLERDLLPFVESGPVAAARTWNFVFLAAFYGLACFFLFPAFLSDWRACLFASIVLLALPGYQRLAATVNPENLLNFGALAGFVALYVVMKSSLSSCARLLAAFGVISALTLTRPLAIVPAAVYSAYIALKPIVRGHISAWRASLRTYALLFAAIAVVGSSWWMYRVAVLGPDQAFRAAPHWYLEKYATRAATFDYTGFYTKTYFNDLFQTPSRLADASDPPCAQNYDTCSGKNDSFFTLLFSETYGEHWLYYSGPPEHDKKVEFKRAALAFGAVFTPLLLVMFLLGNWRAMTERIAGLLPDARMERLEWAVVALIGIGGFVAYMTWQITAGLEPGKNSSVKFTYFAFAVPFLLIFVGRGFPKVDVLAKPLVALSMIGYAVLLPIAAFWV